MRKSTMKAASDKPSKPYADFPLSIHAPTGRFYKKINGKRYYFGKIADGWQAALEKYQQQRDDLYAGRTPRAIRDGLRLHELVNRYLDAKERMQQGGELQQRTWRDYFATCQKLAAFFGRERLVDDLAADDFGRFRLSLVKAGLGPVAIDNEVRRTRGLFKWGFDNGVIAQVPRYGTELKRPSVRTLRLEKAKKPVRLFSAEEVRRMLQAAAPTLRAMILLGINCGLGNADVSEMPIAALDMGKSLLNYPRPKTGIERQAVLWPDTVEALRGVLARRKEPAAEADKGLVFITKYGHRYIRFQDCKKPRPDGRILASAIDGIALEFGKLLQSLGIEREGVGFYSLRHTFRTVADDVGDDRAVDRVMGHHRETDIANVYRHGVPVERLRRVADHVRTWLGDWQKKGSEAGQGSVEWKPG